MRCATTTGSAGADDRKCGKYARARSPVAAQEVDSGAVRSGANGVGMFPHQEPQASATLQVVGSTYDVATAAYPVGSQGVMGCHSHLPATYMTFKID